MTAEPLPHRADPGTVDADNPWPGLASFREADRELFFGRELETQELVRLALRERLTVLFGLSGLGKTSLLRAGLFPLLRQENILPVYVRLDFSEEREGTLAGQVRQAIVREAEAAGIEAPSFPASETLWESLHRQGAELWSPRNRIVTPLLVFDQFEEVFTLGRRNAAGAEETEAFLTELADLCEGSVPASVRERLEADPSATRELSFTRHPYKILLSLREDFLPELEGLRGRIRSIVQNRFRLRRMNGDNALRVVTQAGGHLVEPDAPDRIVRFVAGRESDSTVPLAELEIEPALLSVVCRELNNKRRAQGLPQITAGLVSGNRDEILSELYERSVNDLGPEVRSFIEERLLTKSGFRDTVALENAVESPGVTRAALDKLTDRRLLRIEDRGGQQRLELTHDVLTGVIRKSRDQRRELEAERKLRRSALVIALLALVLLGAVAFAWWGFAAQRKAREALVDSDIERAWNLQSTTPAHALAYLARVIRTEPENIAAQSLLTDLLLDRTWLRPVRVFRNPGEKAIYLSADGRRFITSSPDGTLRVRDTQTFEPVGQPVHAKGSVEEVELGGERLLTAFEGDVIRLWDIRTGREARHIHGEVKLSPDGRWLLWSPDHERITLQEIDTGETFAIRTPFLDPEGLEFTPDGRKLLLYDDRFIVAWDASTRSEVVRPVPEGFLGAALHPDGQRVMTTGFEAVIWDTLSDQTYKNPLPLGELYDPARILLSPDGERILIVPESMDEVRVWSLAAPLKPLATIAAGVDFSEIELSRDGQLALATAEDRIVLLNVYAGERIDEVRCACTSASFVSGTQRIAAVDDGVLRVWSFASARTNTELLPPEDLLPRFSQDGSRLAIAAGGELRVLDTDSGQVVMPPVRMPGHWRRSGLSLGPDGKVFAIWNEFVVELWQLETGNRIASLEIGSQSYTMDIAFSPAGDRIATLSSEGVVQLWSSPEGKPVGGPLRHPKPVSSINFSNDGQQIATAAGDGNARIWDPRSGELLAGPLHLPEIDGIRFESDDRLLTWSPHLIQIWDARSSRPIGKPIRREKEIKFAQASPDGNRLVVLHIDGSIWLLDARTGRPLRSPTSMTSAGTYDVPDVRLSPNGKLLWGITSGHVHVLAVPTFPDEEGDLLARWAEAVGGFRLDEESQLISIPDQAAGLEALRKETVGAPGGQLTAASLIRWFLADPEKRGISPIINRTAEDYLRYYLDGGQNYSWDPAAAAFPGHPLFRKFPRPPTPEDLP